MDNNNPAPIAAAPAPVKKGKGAAIGMVICGILAIAGVGFGVYEMMSKPTQDLKIQVKDTDGEITTIDTSKIEKTDGGKTITIADSVSSMTIPQIRELLKKYVRYFHSSTKNINIFETTSFDEYKYLTAIENIDYQNRVVERIENGAVNVYDLTYDEINEVYHKLFGNSSDVVKAEYSYCGIPAYSSTYDKYVAGTQCGGATGAAYGYDILDYSQKGNQLTIKVAYLKTVPSGYADDRLGLLSSDGGAVEINYFIDMSELIDQLPKFEFTFENTGSGYVLTDFQKTN